MPLVRQLAAAGHDVTGTTRKEERVRRIEEAGATAAVCDAFDRESLDRAIAEAAPEAVVHAMTSLPDRLNYRSRKTFAATNRLRGEGTRNLLAAARAAGAGRVVAQSIAFVYEPQGDWVKGEDAPLLSAPSGTMAAVVDAIAELERQVLGAEGIEGAVLRFGAFYGPATSMAPGRAMAEDVRRRLFPVVGAGTGRFSFVHVEDAAAAAVAAIASPATGVFNVVDDDPVELRAWLPAYAEALGAKPPRHAPLWVASLIVGPAASSAETLRAASNEKAKAELGWEPRYPSWRLGFREALG
jgi:nucleoside-diphosphate-sugar epimerase